VNDTSTARPNLSGPERAAVERGREAAARMRPEPALIETRPTPTPTNESAVRFVAKIDFTGDSHWLWTAATNGNGYGVVNLAGATYLAHRVALAWYSRRQIPPGLVIDHRCRVSACVNPRHLEAVTSRVNTLRGDTLQADQLARQRCPRGHILAGTNLAAYALRRGWRVCRVCAVVLVRAHDALSSGRPDRWKVAQATVSRLSGHETPESIGLAPLPIHRRLDLVSGSGNTIAQQLVLAWPSRAVVSDG
jgi:hypothetical protein